jgi:hypothetical protein
MVLSVGIMTPLATAQTIAELCQSSSGIVAEAIALHKSNASMSRAEQLADKVGAKNERLRSFLIGSIHVAYMHPDYISSLVRTGEWQQQCIEYSTQSPPE